MSTKIIPSLVLSLTCLLLAADVRPRQMPNAAEFAGGYYAGHSYGGSSFKLEGDGTYTQDSGSCTFTTKESGTFLPSDGTLRFTILKFTGKHNDSRPEVDLLDPQNRKEFFGLRDGEINAPLKTEFSLLPVKWGERIYLINETDLRNFANAINLGLEPRAGLSSDTYYGAFFLRGGDEKKSVDGKPSLPAGWQDFILSKPVTAKIVSIEERGDVKVATVNRGSRHGLKVRMKLLGKDQEPSPWSKEGEVLSVEENSAKVSVDRSKVGEILSTRYVPRDIYR